jgi:hypothetical protein
VILTVENVKKARNCNDKTMTNKGILHKKPVRGYVLVRSGKKCYRSIAGQ